MTKPGAMLLTLVVGMMLAGCDRPAAPDSDPNARYYSVRGIIRGIAPDGSSVDVEHEDIPGFMPSMTMPFAARTSKDIAGLKTGDAITFRMIVTDKDLFLDQVRKIDAGDVHLKARTPSPGPTASQPGRLREGDPLPSFNLTNENGEAVNEKTFRGKPLVLTFIFTRCPIPNFCPRMSNNFAELQNAIHSGVNARLLSITLDPDFDTPVVLKQYGASLKADGRIWTFATGNVDSLLEAFAVYRQTEGGTISHGLATALVDGDGRIVRIWRGNAWTPPEVIEAIRSLRPE